MRAHSKFFPLIVFGNLAYLTLTISLWNIANQYFIQWILLYRPLISRVFKNPKFCQNPKLSRVAIIFSKNLSSSSVLRLTVRSKWSSGVSLSFFLSLNRLSFLPLLSLSFLFFLPFSYRFYLWIVRWNDPSMRRSPFSFVFCAAVDWCMMISCAAAYTTGFHLFL